MRKNFGPQSWIYPMPVLMVGSYNEDGTPNAMNAAWGGIYDTNTVMLCLADDHKTTKNIKARGAFTVSFATANTTVPCDYLGMVSGNKCPDKFERAGFHATKSEFVDAPLIDELPMALECELIKFNDDGICIGKIINVSADDAILGNDGKIDADRLAPISYDGATHAYRVLGGVVGHAFSDGRKLDK